MFFASTENFVELQFILLKDCVAIFADFYLRALKYSCSRLLAAGTHSKIATLIDDLILDLHKAWRGTGWQRMYMFVSAAAVRNRLSVNIKCHCGTTWAWKDPHWTWDMYCPGCGTTFRAVPVWSDFGYVVTKEGPADVFGSPQPLIDDLSPEDRKHIYDVWEEFKSAPEVLKFGQRPECPIIFIRAARGFQRSMPTYRAQQLTTFIERQALLEGNGILIMSNCSYVTLLLQPISIEMMECWACGSSIRLLGLQSGKKETGDNYVIGYDPATGQPLLFDVQGGHGKKVCELTKEEYVSKLTGIKPIEPAKHAASS